MRNKRYLTGIDWLIQTLDYTSRMSTGVGNISQLVLELKGQLKEKELKLRLEEIFSSLPDLDGNFRRALNLAPYFKINAKKQTFDLKSIYLKDPDKNKIFSLITKTINRPLYKALSFFLITSRDKSFLVMTFDHRLFDAKGAEALLLMLEKKDLGFSSRSLSAPPHLNNWRCKFQAGKTVNRQFLSLAEGAPSKTVDFPKAKNKDFAFRLICFDRDSAGKIIQKAYKTAGYLFFMPFVLSTVLKRINELFLKQGCEGNDYITSVSVDDRNAREVMSEPFFNHLSFLFFRTDAKQADNFRRILGSIKKQLYQQTKNRFSANLAEASFLMRILPRSILSKIIKLYFRGTESSLSFSFTGESIYNRESFMGCEVENIFHMPRVPIPPGLGVFVNQFQGKLNLVFSYVSGALCEEYVNEFMTELKHDLI